MKKAIVSVLAAVCAMGVVAPAVAQVTVPWSSSFEGFSNNCPLTTINDNTLGAWGGDAELAVVTNLFYDYSAYVGAQKVSYPLNTASHTKVVTFRDGGITNLVSGAGLTNVVLDVMVQPIPTEDAPTTPAVTSSQMSLFVDTNGFIHVYCGILATDSAPDPVTPAWTMLEPAIGTGQWVRLTVTMDYSDSAIAGKNLFEVRANGIPFTNADAFVSLDPFVRSGTWFVCANNTRQEITQVAFSGSGMFDDMVITNGPFALENFVGGVTSIRATAHGNGAISPSGIVQFPVTPADTNFVMAAARYFHITQILTNGVQVTGLTGTEVGYDLSLTNITADGSVDVYFAPDLATKGTPQWWLAGYTNANPAIDIANDTTDVDGDGAREWQEYVAGTIPVDPSSVLKVIEQQIAGTTNTIRWIDSADKLGPYVISASSNLSVWAPISGTLLQVNGTNSYNAVAPGTTPTFYRVAITNYPSN